MNKANAPAFATPSVELPECIEPGQIGLTKRELFAAMAMQGMLADGAVDIASTLAKLSVAYADALLAELSK